MCYYCCFAYVHGSDADAGDRLEAHSWIRAECLCYRPWWRQPPGGGESYYNWQYVAVFILTAILHTVVQKGVCWFSKWKQVSFFFFITLILTSLFYLLSLTYWKKKNKIQLVRTYIRSLYGISPTVMIHNGLVGDCMCEAQHDSK